MKFLILMLLPFNLYSQNEWFQINKDFIFENPKLEKEQTDICIKNKADSYISENENMVKGVSQTEPLNLINVYDDLKIESLLKVINTNIKYWGKKDPNYKIKIGEDYYTASKMLETNKKLYELFSSKKIDEIIPILKNEFKIYKAVSDDSNSVTITGYYESEIFVSKNKEGDFIYPIHLRPDDLIKTPQGYDFDYGRYDENGNIVKYYSTSEIRNGKINKDKELVYSNHPSHIMLAQIQGSSILRYKDGNYSRIGFDGSNGHTYVSVQKILIDCGEVPSMSFKDFIKYLSSQEQKREEELVNLNPRYIFFKNKEKDSLPYGAMGYELVDERSVAIDPKYIPLGLIGLIQSKKPISDDEGNFLGFKDFSRFIATQDTGSAIRGPGRIDLFWGNGKKAETEASSMKALGQFFIFILK